MKHRLAPVHIPKGEAPVNEIVERGVRHRHHRASRSPKVLAGRRRALHRHRRHHVHARSAGPAASMSAAYRQMVHGPARVGLYCSPGKHGRLDREAWWARGKPCEVVAAYGVDPGPVHGRRSGVQRRSVRARRCRWHHGPRGRADAAEHVSLPIPAHAELVIEGLLHRRRHRDGRSTRRVHWLLRRRARASNR